METIFWDVDTQIDFIEPDGNLAVEGAVEIKDNLRQLINFARERSIPLLGSVDYHEEEDAEITDDPDFENTFPPHCLAEAEGQDKIEETRPVDPLWVDTAPRKKEELKEQINEHDGEIYFRKQKFDVFSNPNLERTLDIINPEHIVVFGVTLDVCVRFAAEGFFERGHRVSVVKDATRAIDPAKGESLLKNWLQRGLQVVTTEEIVERLGP